MCKKYDILSRLPVGVRFRFKKGKAVYEITSPRLMSTSYVHLDTGQEFKLNIKQKGFLAQVEIVSKSDYNQKY